MVAKTKTKKKEKTTEEQNIVVSPSAVLDVAKVEVVKKTQVPPAKRLLPHNLVAELDALTKRVEELEKKLQSNS